jgi:hypothetical protein
MAGGPSGHTEGHSVLGAAVEQLRGLGGSLQRMSGPELAELVGTLDEVAATAGAARVQVVAEAVRRGEVAQGEAHDWVREHCPSLRQGGAGQVATVAVEVATSGSSLAAVDPEPGGTVAVVWDAVRSGRLSPANAVAVWRELDRLVPLLQAEAVPTVTTSLVDLAGR